MTPQYASPEQLLGRVVNDGDGRLLAGRAALRAAHRAQAVRRRHALAEYRGPASREQRGQHRARCAATSTTSSWRALEVDPARRYGSVEKFAEDVRRYLSGHPIAARRATFGYRAAKFVRRNLLAVAAAVAIVVIAAIAFAATLHQKRIAERRFDEVRSLAPCGRLRAARCHRAAARIDACARAARPPRARLSRQARR